MNRYSDENIIKYLSSIHNINIVELLDVNYYDITANCFVSVRFNNKVSNSTFTIWYIDIEKFTINERNNKINKII